MQRIALEIIERIETIIMKKKIPKTYIDDTYHDLSKGYRFDKKSMEAMAKKAEEHSQRYMEQREMEYSDFFYRDITIKELINLIKKRKNSMK